MPLARGGMKYLRRIRPRGTRIRKIRPAQLLGEGGEGSVHAVSVTIRQGKRVKAIKLAQKTFLPVMYGQHGMPQRNFSMPVAQFNTMTRLRELNRVKKLGLHIVPTFRLVRTKKRRPVILTTLLKEVKGYELVGQAHAEFEADIERQLEILGDEGYKCNEDAFMPVRDPETGKCIAILFDFGNVQRREIKVT